MENASKALLMAGGVLIALLIIGVIVFMFTLLGRNQQSQEDMLKSQQIAKYNNQFEPYNRDKLSLIDLKTIYNKLTQYNIKTNIEELFKTNKITLPGTEAITDHPERGEIVNFAMFINEFSNIKDAYKNKSRVNFRCDGNLKYDEEGRLSEMNFEIAFVSTSAR